MRTGQEVPVGAEGAKHWVFVIGTIRKGEQKLVFPQPADRPVFPGPWKIRASVSS